MPYNISMDLEQAQILNELNKRFYERHSSSFSESRNAPWDGWSRVLEHIVSHAKGNAIDALDIACGNGRFEVYACLEYPSYNWSFLLIDSDTMLLDDAKSTSAKKGIQAQFEQRDILEALLKRSESFQLAYGRQYTAALSFGFMHHVPGQENRIRLLETLCDAVESGGIVAVSLWRFADNDAMAIKARESTESLNESGFYQLEQGDYLLGWQGTYEKPRYCHSFSDQDIDEIIDSSPKAMRLIDRFRSDGRDDRLNEYLVFERL